MTKPLRRGAARLIATLLALIAAFPALPAMADTLVENVQGVTIGESGELESFTGLLLGDDGRVKEVYHKRSEHPKKVDYRVDGQGRYLVPGMIDAHLHVMGLGFGQITLDLSDTNSLQEALDKVAAWSAAHPNAKWIIGRGWNQEKWGLGRFPTAAELDAVVGDRPVWLERVDGHAGWANSAAMTAAGVTAATKDPAGGRIERVGGKPSGIFVDHATALIAAALPRPRPEDRDLALAEAQKLLLSKGVTAVADMGTTIEDWQSFRRAGDGGWLQIRIMSYAAGPENMELIGGPGPSPWLYDDKLRLNGVKLYLDGALGSRGAWLKAPYADDPRNSGLPLLTPAQLRNLMSRAAIDHFQVAVHAIGDAANAEVLSAVDEMADTYTGDRRWRIEHAQIVDPADIAMFGQHGIIASMQPVHETSDRLMAEARLGPDRLAGAYAWRSIRSTGAHLAFGSDAPVEAPEPFIGIAAAISRTGPDGQPFGGWQPQETVDRTAAFAGYTSEAAYAGFADGRFGKLVPGERADFLLIDQDPLLASPAQLRATKVLETWVGGRKVWSADGSK
ncbi:MAG: amidohydrolase [Sphingomonadales bacterium]|nr:amidohydrolase [Sphingomonadales bacterium]MBD3773703.1 amidohydrolase [Paracoccaceae bacterium]